MSEINPSAPVPCRCRELDRLDGDDATTYASDHLRLVERGRGNYETYLCRDTGTSWIMDFPLGHWAADRRGTVRLRREPIDHESLPVGALDN